MKHHFLILLILPLLFIVACRKNVCENAIIRYSVYSRDSLDIVNMTLRRYERTPDFAHFIAIDPTYAYATRLVYSSGYSFLQNNLYLDPAYNYIFTIGNKQFKIRDIYFDSRTERANGLMSEIDPCYNVIHYTVNDSFYTATPNSDSRYYAYYINLR